MAHRVSLGGTLGAMPPYCLGPKLALSFAWVGKCKRCLGLSWATDVAKGPCQACRSERALIQKHGAKPEQLRFGVEMETEGISYARQAGEVVKKKLRKGVPGIDWEAKDDGSLRGNAAEVTTRPLPFTPEGLAEMRLGAKLLRNAGARTSVRCGTHIHVGCEDLTYSQLASLAEWWMRCQKAVLAALPIGSNRANYCQPFTPVHISRTRQYRDAKYREGFGSVTDKYCAMNMRHLGPSGYNTVEFRLFNGTLHGGKLTAYVTLVTTIVSHASRNIAPLVLASMYNTPPWPEYPGTREGVIAMLDELGITDKSSRYHLLGKFATEQDAPVPDGYVPAPKKKRKPIEARPEKINLGRNWVVMSGREYTRLNLGCGIYRLGGADSPRSWTERMTYWPRWCESNLNSSGVVDGRITRADATNDLFAICIHRRDWDEVVNEGRVSLLVTA